MKNFFRSPAERGVVRFAFVRVPPEVDEVVRDREEGQKVHERAKEKAVERLSDRVALAEQLHVMRDHNWGEPLPNVVGQSDKPGHGAPNLTVVHVEEETLHGGAGHSTGARENRQEKKKNLGNSGIGRSLGSGG